MGCDVNGDGRHDNVGVGGREGSWGVVMMMLMMMMMMVMVMVMVMTVFISTPTTDRDVFYSAYCCPARLHLKACAAAQRGSV